MSNLLKYCCLAWSRELDTTTGCETMHPGFSVVFLKQMVARIRCSKIKCNRRKTLLSDTFGREVRNSLRSWRLPETDSYYIMRRSIRNFNIPPRAYPGHLTVHRARGGREFERCVGRVGNLNRIYLLFWRNRPVNFFGFCGVWRIYKIEYSLC